MKVLVQGENAKVDDFVPLTNGNDNAITKKIYGNNGASINPIVTNAPKAKVYVEVPAGAKGTINIEAYNN